MKINYQILCLALILCVGYLLFNQNTKMNPQEAVLETIFNRTSVRSFSDEPVSDETLELLVKAGMAAPTAGNMQPWEFVIVNNKELLKELGAMHKFSAPAAAATAGIVVLADMNTYKDRPEFEKFWIADTSAATENILLAIQSMGLGGVWLSVYPWDEREAKVKEILNLEDDRKVLCVIALGHPTADQTPKDKWKPAKLFWNEQE